MLIAGSVILCREGYSASVLYAAKTRPIRVKVRVRVRVMVRVMVRGEVTS